MTFCHRVLLGKKSAFSAHCFAGGFIGADYASTQDLVSDLPKKLVTA
jgi:hypothetical protein